MWHVGGIYKLPDIRYGRRYGGICSVHLSIGRWQLAVSSKAFNTSQEEVLVW